MSDLEKGLVLVTGGTGYLGSWIVAALLRDGYRVRTTVRNPKREDETRTSIRRLVAADDRLQFVTADLLSDHGWDAACDGAVSVMHVASPMQVGEFRNSDVIRPAREGMMRVLRAAAKVGVRRVVITSSGLAATPRAGVSDETVWTDLTQKGVSDYARAKTLAEQDAWAFAAATPQMQLTTILPGFIAGPVLGRDFSGSIEVLRRLLTGEVSALPRLGFSIVDVRDLVELHIRAMHTSKAVGQRFIGAGEFLWLSDIAAHLRQELGEAARKVPQRTAPDWLVRLAALFQPEMRQLVGRLGVREDASTAKARAAFGWMPRPARVSVLDTAKSLIEARLAH